MSKNDKSTGFLELKIKLFFRNIVTNEKHVLCFAENYLILFHFLPLIRKSRASTRFHSNRIETKT